MNDVLRLSKKSLTYTVVASTIAWSLGLSMLLVPLSASAASAGDVVQGSGKAIYYVGADGKRYVFPHDNVFFSWGLSFDQLKKLSDAELSAMALGGSVLKKPGTLVQFVTSTTPWKALDPRVFVVLKGKMLAKIANPAAAIKLKGNDWEKKIHAVDEGLFTSYGTVAVSEVTEATADGILTGVAGSIMSDELKSGATSTTPVAGAVTVSLAADNPAATTFVAGQAAAHVLTLAFNNTGSVIEYLSGLKLSLFGVAADTTASAVSYYYENGSIAADEATVSSDRIVNSQGINVSLPPGLTKIKVKTNIAASTNGQTLGFELAEGGVTLKSGAKVTGSAKSNLHQIASASLATVAFATSTTPTTNTSLDPQNEFTAWQNSLTVGTRKVKIGGKGNPIIFQVIGSVDKKKDLTKWRLTFDGKQFGSELEYAGEDGYLAFEQEAVTELETGTRVTKVMTNVVGGATLNFSVRLRKAAHFLAQDSNFGANVLVTGDGSSTTNVYSEHSSGTQTVTGGAALFGRHSSSSSDDLVLNARAVLGVFEGRTTGQKRRVNELRVAVDSSGTGTAMEWENGSVEVSSDSGATWMQVGSTATLPEIADTSTSGYRAYALGSSVIMDVVKPTLFRVWATVKDVDGTNDVAAGQTATVRLAVGVSNIDAMVSGGVESSPLAVVTANTRRIVVGGANISKDQSLGNQSKVVPTLNDIILGRWTVYSSTPSEPTLLDTATVEQAVTDEWAVGDVSNLYIRTWSVADPTTAKNTSIRSTGAASQTWSISQELGASGIVFELRGKIETGAVVTETAADTGIFALLVSGTTTSSGQAVSTNGGAALAGQTMTALLRENINVSLEATTAASHQRIAGTTDAEPALKVKVAAGSRGGGYITRVALRVDANADDSVLSSVSLWKAIGSGAFTQVSLTKSWNPDGATNPGFVEWDLASSERIEVPPNGTVILAARPTWVSSSETTISAQTPAIYLSDLKVDGSSTTITPNGTGANLIVNSGLILASTTTSTFVADATATQLGAALTAAATAATLNAAPTIDQTGNFGFIDQDDDATFDSGEEIFYAAEAGTGDATVIFTRGVGGTIAAAADLNDNVYFITGVKGNAMTILRNKLSVAVSPTSPSGATTAGTGKLIGRFVFYAADNALDPSDNAIVVDRYDIVLDKSASTARNVITYPTANALNGAYASTCGAISTTKWRCVPSSTGGANQVPENGSQSVDVYADTGFSAAGAIQLSFPTPGTSSAVGNNFGWTDALASGNTQYWLDQQAVYFPTITTTSSAGTPDSTSPTISSIVFANVLTAGTIANTDTVTVTFSEVIDASTIGAINPGDSGVALDGGDGDVAVTSDGAGGNDTMAITGIATGVVLGTNLSASATYTPTGALNTAGTVLTITLAGASATPTITAANGAGTQGTGVTDANGNAMAAVATPAPTGSF